MTSPDDLRTTLLAAHYDWWRREMEPAWEGSAVAHKGAFDTSADGYAAGYSFGFTEAEAGRSAPDVLRDRLAAHLAWWTTAVLGGPEIPKHIEAFGRAFSQLGWQAGAAFGYAAQRG